MTSTHPPPLRALFIVMAFAIVSVATETAKGISFNFAQMEVASRPQGMIVVSDDTPTNTPRLSLVARGLEPSATYTARFGKCVRTKGGGGAIRFRSTPQGTALLRRALPGAVLKITTPRNCTATFRFEGLPGEDSFTFTEILISSFAALTPTVPDGPRGLVVVSRDRRGEPKGVLIALLLPWKAERGESVNAGPYSLTVPLGQGNDELASVAVSPDGSAFVTTTLDDQAAAALAKRQVTRVAVGDVNNDIVALGPLTYGSFGELPRIKAEKPSAP